MASHRISVRVPSGLVNRLRERSQSSGARESEIVRKALEEYLSENGREETAYDAALKAGLIGCAEGAPRDLSTNKKYFEGFGKGR